MSDATRIGEQFGDFLRGLLRAPVAAPAESPEAIQPPRKWAVIDANEVATGVMVSLDLELDPSEPPGQMTRDPEANGLVHFPTGVTSPLNLVVAKDYANAITLTPAVFPGAQPNTVVNGWHLVADGDLQPFSKSPYQISFFERLVPGTDVTRIGGHIFDPNTQQRVNFSVTHDPIETIILVVVAGFAALICGGVVLHDAILNAGQEKAQAQCGERGVKKLTIKRKYGFGWKKGGVDVGCGEDYIIECNPLPEPSAAAPEPPPPPEPPPRPNRRRHRAKP